MYHSPMGGVNGFKSGKLVLLIGPSGVGKSAILRTLMQRHPEFHVPKSATTRPRRLGESLDLYHFVSDEQFDALIDADKVLEWAVVHGKARYGTIRDEIVPYIEEGKIVVREVDVQGFLSIKKHPIFSDDKHRLQSIFVLPEKQSQLIDRILKRSKMSKDELTRRLKSMEEELAHAKDCTNTVVNKDNRLDETIGEVERLIVEN